MTEQPQNPSSQMQENLSELLSFHQTQAVKGRLKLQHQKIEAANKTLQKQELQRSQMLHQLNQPEILAQDENFF